jgi:hypothetical protein
MMFFQNEGYAEPPERCHLSPVPFLLVRLALVADFFIHGLLDQAARLTEGLAPGIH